MMPSGLPPSPPRHSPRMLDAPGSSALDPFLFQGISSSRFCRQGSLSREGSRNLIHGCIHSHASNSTTSSAHVCQTGQAHGIEAFSSRCWPARLLRHSQALLDQEGESISLRNAHGVPFHDDAESGHQMQSNLQAYCWYDEAPLPCGLLPSQLSDLLFRDITPEDYDTLLQLDSQPFGQVSFANTPALPSVSAADTEQVICMICLATYEDTERVTRLPCDHVFHIACIAQWLSLCKRNCPLCSREIGLPSCTAVSSSLDGFAQAD